jgi:hypothetical protein
VIWQQLGHDFEDHVFRCQILDQNHGHWQDTLREILASPIGA